MVAPDGSLLTKQASPSSAVDGINARACRYAALSADVEHRMLIALLLFLVGVVLIVSNPILGFIPGLTCPDCRSKIPSAAAVCRYWNYRYPQR
jgi:hypothetical protein